MKHLSHLIAQALFLLYCLFAYSEGHAQTRPSSTISQLTNDLCIGCQITEADLAWDKDPASGAFLEVDLTIAGGYGEVVYQFTDPVPQHNIIRLQMQLSGSGTLSGLASAQMFDQLAIQLLDAGGNELASYRDAYALRADVLSATDNIFEISIVNPDAATQRIRITRGSLVTVPVANRDLYIRDVMHIANDIDPVTTAEGSGSSNVGLGVCILCGVQDDAHATGSYDINQEYTKFAILADVGTGYYYSRYSWGTSEYDGDDYDLYLVLQNASLASVGTELLFFENGNLSVVVEYSDGDEEVITYGSGLVSAHVLGVGSGRFYLKIDIDDSKAVDGVEVRFGGNLVDLANNLRLYTVFASSHLNDPFAVDDHEAAVTVAESLHVDQYANGQSLLSTNDTDGALLSAVLSAGTLPPGTQLHPVTGDITVSDASLLEEGTFPITIGTTDLLGGTTVVSASIAILPPSDVEATYTTAAPRLLNQYETGDILASATDPDGAITAATLTSALLPPGTMLEADGTLQVGNASLLVAGTYTLDITTTDENGGSTDHSITLSFSSADLEAVYTLSTPKPVNEYSTGDMLASAEDLDGDITSATVSNGTLPAGVMLEANGTLTVGEASLLVAGTYAFAVTTTDSQGGTTDTVINLIVLSQDNEATYTVEASKPSDQYTDGERIATAADVDGPIVTALVTLGSLPAGTILSSDGSVTVSDTDQLVAGTSVVTILTTDEQGGTSETIVAITVDEIGNTDHEAIYSVRAAKPVSDYADGQIIATVYDEDGVITNAVIDVGTLPAGMAMTTDGVITVDDASLLLEGSTSLVLITTDALDQTTVHSVTLQVYPADVEATYTLAPSQPVSDYLTGAALATAFDPNGSITVATFHSDNLPAGTDLKADGTLLVSDPDVLVAGTYPLDITTTDEYGGTTVHTIQLILLPSDREAIYTVATARRVDEYAQGEVLATADDPDGVITTAILRSGALPPGVNLDPDGTLTVETTSMLAAGTYRFEVTTTDEENGTTVSAIELVFNASDQEASYTVYPARARSAYQPGDTLAWVTDADGEVLSATVTQGEAPAGVSLQPNGTILVSDTAALEEGSYPLTITTQDSKGGETNQIVTLVIEPDDQQAVYTLPPPRPASHYEQNDTIASVSDKDGGVLSTTVAQGELPPGMALLPNGTIVVTDPAQLEPDRYTIVLQTTDATGGTTQHELELTVLAPLPADVDSEVVVFPSQPIDQYQPNDTLVSVSDQDGVIVEASVDEGELPTGTALTSDGTIYIDDPSRLTADTYDLTLTYVDIQGGRTTTNVAITLEEPTQLVTPLPGFSPDNNGQNDKWYIKDIEKYPNNVVRVFNRWGDMVFVQKGYNNDGQAWAGTANIGQLLGKNRLPQGTYFYTIELGTRTSPVTGYIILKY